MANSLLPPNATLLERALEHGGAGLSSVAAPVEALWSPEDCPAALLPWLAWGLSVDLWDPDWTEQAKRDAIADSIAFHRRKGTPASLRLVLDRFDPLIKLVEWFDAAEPMDPYTFRLDLPLTDESDVVYTEALVLSILRDIASVKPVRAQMTVVYRLVAEAEGWLVSGAQLAGFDRFDMSADTTSALDPFWDALLQTEQGEPFETEAGILLEEG